jgi:hypothetical protein
MTNLPQDIYARIMHALDLISQGETPTKAYDQAFVSKSVVEKYIASDPALQQLAIDAHSRGFDTLADVLLDIDTDPRYGASDPKIMKVKSDNIKWYLTKRDSQRYGEKVVVENRITADRAIVEALSRGKQRVLNAAQKAFVEDADFVVVDDTDVSQFT